MKCLVFLTFAFFIISLPINAQSNAIEIYNTGRNLEGLGRIQEAETYYNQAVQICNEEIARNNATRNTYTALTWTLLRQRKYSEVIIWGERGLRLFADEFRILETMGEAYFHIDDYSNSLMFMQRYINSLPEGERVSIAYFFVGEIYRLQNKNRLADIAYSTAVRLQPDIALWWYRLGSVREYSGDSSTAADAYERALRLDPNYQAANDGLGRVRRQP